MFAEVFGQLRDRPEVFALLLRFDVHNDYDENI